MAQDFLIDEVDESIEDFKWDAPDATFEVDEGKPEKKDKISDEEKAKKAEEAKLAKEKEDEDFDDTDFVNTEDEDEDNENDKNKNKDKGKEKDTESTSVINEDNENQIYSTLATELKDKGIFQNVEIKDGEEITAEKFFELHDAEVEARVNETFEGFFEELKEDEDAIAFIQFKKNGGSTAEFFQTYARSSDIPDIDITDPKNHETFLEYYYREVDGLDREEASDKIEWNKERGKIAGEAEKLHTKLTKQVEKDKADLLEAQKEQKEKQEKANKEYVTTVSETISKVEKVNDFTFTPQDKKELGAYITNPSVKTGKNQFITPFYRDLGEILKNKDKTKLLLLAKLLKTDFDTKDLDKVKTTKVAKEVKSKLADIKLNVKTSSSNKTQKTLADYIS